VVFLNIEVFINMKVSREACSSSDPCSGLSDVSGCLSSSQLKTVDVGNNNKLQSDAADAFMKMYEDMPDDIKKSVKLTDTYRPLKIQCNIFDFDYYEKTGKRRKKGTASTAAATPGGSNHGWGRAIDIFPENVQKWIVENGEKYGWTWNEGKAVKEPWHFTYCGPGPNKNEKWCSGVSIDMDTTSSNTNDDENDDNQSTTTTTTKKDGSSMGPIGDFLNFFGIGGDMKDSVEKNKKLDEELERIHDIFKKIL